MVHLFEFALIGIVAVVVLAILCLLVGFIAEQGAPAVRWILWPIAFVLAILVPGWLLAAMFFGFMRPGFASHIAKPEDQTKPQRAMNGFFELLAAPWAGSRQASVTSESA